MRCNAVVLSYTTHCCPMLYTTRRDMTRLTHVMPPPTNPNSTTPTHATRSPQVPTTAQCQPSVAHHKFQWRSAAHTTQSQQIPTAQRRLQRDAAESQKQNGEQFCSTWNARTNAGRVTMPLVHEVPEIVVDMRNTASHVARNPDTKTQ